MGQKKQCETFAGPEPTGTSPMKENSPNCADQPIPDARVGMEGVTKSEMRAYSYAMEERRAVGCSMLTGTPHPLQGMDKANID